MFCLLKPKNSLGLNTVAYYHHDHLQTPLQATDKAGNIVWSATYNVFGQAIITTPSATELVPTIESNLRLPGQYEDTETGLHYNFNRYYDPQTGRYISQDPIGLAGGINRFSYVNHNPLNSFDPSGLLAFGDPLPQGFVDTTAAFGDTLSFGITDEIRELLGTNNTVNKCSDAYNYGEWGGIAYSLAFGAAHFGRHAINVGAKRFFYDPRQYGTVQRQWSKSVGGYKGQYELHHWFTPQSFGGKNAGWNLVPLSPGFNNAMGNQGLLFNAFKYTFISTYLSTLSGMTSPIWKSNGCTCSN